MRRRVESQNLLWDLFVFIRAIRGKKIFLFMHSCQTFSFVPSCLCAKKYYTKNYMLTILNKTPTLGNLKY